MSKTAFLYPGQGAQKAGMGADFYKRSEVAAWIYDQASQLLDLDMKKLCFEENWIRRSIHRRQWSPPALQ